MLVNRQIFFKEFKKTVLDGGTLSQNLVEAIERFLDFAEKDKVITSLGQMAYVFATAWHETAHTFEPVREYGSKDYFIRRYWNNVGIRNQLGNKQESDAYRRNGRGYVQLTGLANDIKCDKALRLNYKEIVKDFENSSGKTFNLVTNPEQALHPAIAYAVISYGMSAGLFTSKKLSNYIKSDNPTSQQFRDARKIVNGTDKAALIAGHAVDFLHILKESTKIEPENSVEDLDKRITDLIGETPEEKPEEKPVINEQPVQDVVSVTNPEPYQGKGFWSIIKRDISVATGGNLTLNLLLEYLRNIQAQIQGFQIPERWYYILIILAAVTTLGWFVFRLIHYGIDSWKKNERVKLETLVNTDIKRKDMRWVDKGDPLSIKQ